ncbi:hypothetical protein TUN199_02700 [Pyrenophora tritici-repentis]|uniref:Uncharacterized protein n=1 Tax=Pyrenophora tritici-repentis TaxID=45151 RepID=A0A5M9LJ03_9PLEO|nr:hypothetical protein PtrV1_04868 [Pyrenophora tritici-repentis]KAF7452568.1 hypothetical protein A1F99_043460 [Pyrenophora tritici-repentis]KAF7574298.1 hypothetical protein PtrM4_059210 [Pyrenophora tritici-repentis]KAI0586904.1 hypothetical protein Alg215_01785 [Pyrenophora tritici-repentis]KAI0589660.1 hypothetical protein Alg130_02824 [Pyrenophora tritici-repentis]
MGYRAGSFYANFIFLILCVVYIVKFCPEILFGAVRGLHAREGTYVRVMAKNYDGIGFSGKMSAAAGLTLERRRAKAHLQPGVPECGFLAEKIKKTKCSCKVGVDGLVSRVA